MNYHRLPALAKKINCIITFAILLLPLFYGLSGHAQFKKNLEIPDKTYLNAYIGQFFANRPQPCTAFDTLLKPANLAPLLEQTIADSMLQIQYMASYFFHQMLNEYRVSRQRKWLHWDSNLWLSAHNQNMFLSKNIKSTLTIYQKGEDLDFGIATTGFTHYQKEGDLYFSGVSPSNRLGYVNGRSDNNVSENIYSGHFVFSEQRYSVAMVAKAIAGSALALWKESPGHNANMLNKDHGFEATAFLIEKSVWPNAVSTSIFATTNFAPSYYSKATPDIAIYWDKELAVLHKPMLQWQDGKIVSGKPLSFYADSIIVFAKNHFSKAKTNCNNAMCKAANKQLQRMKKRKALLTSSMPIESKQAGLSVKMHYSRFAGIKGMLGKRMQQRSLSIPIKITDFADHAVIRKIKNRLKTLLPVASGVQDWGVATNFIYTSEHYVFFICIIWR